MDGLPWQAVCDQASGPVAVLDLGGRYIYANPAFCELLGYEPDYIFGRTPRDFTYPDPAVDRDVADQIAETIGGYTVQKRFARSDGSVIWVNVNGSVIRDNDDQPIFFLTQLQDVSAQREAELLWRRTLNSAPIGMALLDLDGRWREVNDKLCELVGYSREDMLTMHFTDLTYPDDQDTGTHKLAELVQGVRDTVSIEKRYRHKDGYPFWMLIRSSVVPGPDGSPDFLVSQYEVLGHNRMSDAHLEHMALHDPLTGLANRALLNDRLDHALNEMGVEGGQVTVVLADLDDLKRVNDDYGHAAGDQLITAAAHQLLGAAGPGDTVARFGGDEFVVVSRIPAESDATVVRDRISGALRTDIVASGYRLRLTASVGLAVTADPTTPAGVLLHDADRDMYAHKRSTRRMAVNTGTDAVLRPPHRGSEPSG